MEITIRKELAEAIGLTKFKPFGIEKESWGWRTQGIDLDLSRFDAGKLDHLEGLLATQAKVRGAAVALRDIATWKAAIKDAKGLKPRTVRAFETILQQFLLKVPGHRLYAKSEHDPELWEPFYVNRIEYEPPNERVGNPAQVVLYLLWEEFGGRRSSSEHFRDFDVRGMNCVEILARKGWYAETPELRQQHLAHLARFSEIHPQVGKQFLATGFGSDDVDGNPEGRRDSWYWKRTHQHGLLRTTGPSRVVVDVFYEEDGSRRESGDSLRSSFWPMVRSGALKSTEDGDQEAADEVDLSTQDPDDVPEIPVHPYLAVFDLARHLRLRVHVGQLTEYQYDPHLADKLVLSEDRKALVRLLVEHKSGGFQDIVKGKAGGAVVLLAGPPGTGKTLTAEVYAEAEGRALYSIQCSQLGTDPEALEDELLKVFARSKRWNAVMLLDEADVYVHERGNDLTQNAIVGVFLRVLEYQDAVLFLTTNRPDDVDDAIASRCIAKLSYDVPDQADQARIWHFLADATGVPKGQLAVDAIVAANPGLSGRDVKNLLKLAKLINPEKIDPATIEFVKQFKPTKGQTPTVVAAPAGIARCPKCGVLVGKKGHVCPKG